jgi:hypothetical protein
MLASGEGDRFGVHTLEAPQRFMERKDYFAERTYGFFEKASKAQIMQGATEGIGQDDDL